jgi:hypothetical protein
VRNNGVQTAAFNLPNDERVVKEKGSARIMLKNVQDAKFNKRSDFLRGVDCAQQRDIAFDSFFCTHARINARFTSQHHGRRPGNRGALAAHELIFG